MHCQCTTIFWSFLELILEGGRARTGQVSQGVILSQGPINHCRCPICDTVTSRWNSIQSEHSGKKVPAKTFCTMPVGPVLQALYANPESAKAMKYRQEQTRNMARDFLGAHGSDPNRIFEDLMSGDDYQKLVADGAIDDDDILLMLSMDGAQLYEHKISDCWIYILVILELSPDKRYKKRHVIPGGFIPGPKKPKNIDSFLFPGLYHIACLQKEDFRVYDSDLCTPIRKFPKAILKTAVGPGMACLNGLVGHNGARGCRIYCKVPSRHRDSHTHYYPVLLKPDNFAVARSDHGDVNLKTYSPYSSQESTTKSNSRTTNSTTEKPEVPDVVDGHQIDVLVNNPQAAQVRSTPTPSSWTFLFQHPLASWL